MSQTFAATSSYYNLGAPSNLTNVTRGGYVAIVKSSAPGVARILYNKGTSANYIRRSTINATDTFTITLGSATTSLQAQALLTNFAGCGPGKWIVVAARFDTSLTNADQQLFACPVGGALAQPSAYALQAVGSGHGSDGADVAHIGDSTVNTLGFTDPMAALAVLTGSYPSVEELQRVANELLVRGRKLRLPASCKGAWQFTQRGTVPDLSGNGNHGVAGGGVIGQAGDPVWRWPLGQAYQIPGMDPPAAAASTASGLFGDRRRRFVGAFYRRG